MGLLILAFHAVNDTSVIAALFKVASYTYGPLLGLFAFSLLYARPTSRPGWTASFRLLQPDCPALGWMLEQGRFQPRDSALDSPFFRSMAS